MAKDKRKKDESNAGGGIGGFVIAALIAIVLGAGGGGAYGYLLMPDVAPQNSGPTDKAPPPAGPTAGRFPGDAIELAIPSVITDLNSEPAVRARLDVSIIVVHGTPQTTTLLGEVREDVIAYLKGLSLADIQGVRGFQNLREQLDDRARVRGRGAILGLLIGGLVLE
ncbi:flagellar basal body-associated FliL family protein [Hyphomicrobium sp. B1]|uniref:flagellar basal body-associated FliL family protein n=1 Tax=Hyphomicrobium sp. B1 TaxID=3075651 RepID=UPI003C2B50C7